MTVTGDIDAAAISTLGNHLVGPELIFALVKPVGTPDDDVINRLQSELGLYGYSLEHIKMSRLLSDVAEDDGRAIDSSFEDARITALIEEGDRLCSEEEDAAAVALLAVSEIRRLRIEHNLARELPPNAGSAEFPVARKAYLIDSLKRPAEVIQLREIYGDHFLLLGLLAEDESRIASLLNLMRPQRTSMRPDQLRDLAEGLIKRDQRESSQFGQNTLKSFPLSDIFINVDGDSSAQIVRSLRLLFGDPDYQVPTEAEYGMRLAHDASTRSPELGLKVGAAIVSDTGSIIALGANVHPEAAGSPDFDASALDIRELVLDTLTRLREGHLNKAAALALTDNPDLFVKDLLKTTLADSKIADLTEFQPTVHAEMNALLDAMTKQASLSGSTVYVTAFPCHGCAKHLIAARQSVCYLEPYPKSRAVAMYGKRVADTFFPFEGIAPRSYDRLFSVGSDRKDANGSRQKWSSIERRQSRPKVNRLIDWVGISDREANAVGMLTWFADNSAQPRSRNGGGSVVPP